MIPRSLAVSRTHRGWLGASLGVLIVAVMLPLTIFLVSAWLLGWQLVSVQTGSMRPTYHVGSLLVVGQIDAADVETGMAIVFEDPTTPGRLVTHRVVALAAGAGLAFVTRGDANTSQDPAPVPARKVHGRVLWSVTHLGAFMDWFQWPRSFVLLVVTPGILLAIAEVRARRGLRADRSLATADEGTATTA